MFTFSFNRKKLETEVEKNVRTALKMVGKGISRSIKDSFGASRSSPGAPPGVISGRLQDSITWATSFGPRSRAGGRASPSDGVSKPKELIGTESVVIGSNVPYALALEMGYRKPGRRTKTYPRPYLWPALKNNSDLIKEAFRRV